MVLSAAFGRDGQNRKEEQNRTEEQNRVQVSERCQNPSKTEGFKVDGCESYGLAV